MKRSLTKKIGNIRAVSWKASADGQPRQKLFVHWDRQPKGRYFMTPVRVLLEHGTLIRRASNRELEIFFADKGHYRCLPGLFSGGAYFLY